MDFELGRSTLWCRERVFGIVTTLQIGHSASRFLAR